MLYLYDSNYVGSYKTRIAKIHFTTQHNFKIYREIIRNTQHSYNNESTYLLIDTLRNKILVSSQFINNKNLTNISITTQKNNVHV